MAFPATFDKEKNTIDEFMIEEYESIASAHFDSQSGLRQQFRFYLLIAAVPITVLGLVFRDRPPEELAKISLFSLPSPFNYIFFMIGLLGALMLLSMVHTALDATLYARTVNGVRAYFVDRATTLDSGFDFKSYLKMPTDQRRPPYFHIRAFFWQLIFIAAINSFYFAVGISGLYRQLCLTVTVPTLFFVAQYYAYQSFCKRRETNEISPR